MFGKFWTSRKFAYAAGTFLAALIVAVLPWAGVPSDTVIMLHDMLPYVCVGGFLLLTGHTATDLVSLLVGVQPKQLAQAAHDLIDAVAGDDAP